jgi:hypothetical protein
MSHNVTYFTTLCVLLVINLFLPSVVVDNDAVDVVVIVVIVALDKI